MIRAADSLFSGHQMPRYLAKHLLPLARIYSVNIDHERFAARLDRNLFHTLCNSMHIRLVSKVLVRIQVNIVDLDAVRPSPPDHRTVMSLDLTGCKLHIRARVLTAVILSSSK